MAEYKLEVKVDTIWYLNTNIGDDFEFAFTVENNVANFSKQLTFGQQQFIGQSIYEGTLSGDRSLPISVLVTEVDPVYNDSGYGQTTMNLDYSFHSIGLPSSEDHIFSVIVNGDPTGDSGRVAHLGIKLRAWVTECTEGQEVTVNNVRDPAGERSLGTFEVPALTPPGNVGLMIKEFLENIGDPGDIASRVDDFLNLTSIHATKAFDVWEVFATNICDAVYKCEQGDFTFDRYENCQEEVSQRKIRSIQFPEERDLRDSIIQKVTNVVNELGNL